MIDYSRINFVNYPYITTPINAERLNIMDKAIYDLDTGIGAATEASDVTGNTVFAKIGTLYSSFSSAISSLSNTVNNKVTYNGESVDSIDFSVSGTTLTITTTTEGE